MICACARHYYTIFTGQKADASGVVTSTIYGIKFKGSGAPGSPGSPANFIDENFIGNSANIGGLSKWGSLSTPGEGSRNGGAA